MIIVALCYDLGNSALRKRWFKNGAASWKCLGTAGGLYAISDI